MVDDASGFAGTGSHDGDAAGEQGRDRPRESTFLRAEVRFLERSWTVRVRNISAGGMMVDPAESLARGDAVEVRMEGVGQVRATVAWVDGRRMGLAFAEEIDPRLARKRVCAARSATVPAPPADRSRRPGLRVS